MRTQQVNVLLLGAAFHLLFFSFQTSVFIQQTVVNSIRLKPQHEFTGDGYLSLCLTYAVFALSNWLAPSLVALTGLKWAMFLGALTYVLYSASFIQPSTCLFYSAAGLIGLGAGLLWTAQGGFLARNSDAHTASRNAAIFWSMLQSSILFGNLFVYFAFDSQAEISDRTRQTVYAVLTLVGALGTLTLLLLRETGPRAAEIEAGAEAQAQTGAQTGAELRSGSQEEEEEEEEEAKLGAWRQFVGALRLARSRDMALLATAFLFTGQLLSFFTGVYGTAIGATREFGPEAKRYIGLAGIFIGLGEILGGSIFGLLGARVHKRLGRDTIFVLGYLATLGAIALTFVNLPADSPLAGRAHLAAIIEPRIWISMVGSLLIGLGDACFNTQIYSLLMTVCQRDSVGAFALFKFVQSAGSALAFLYSSRLNLYWQLLILALVSTLATICFCLVEWRGRREGATQLARSRRRTIEKTDSQQEIIASDALARQRDQQHHQQHHQQQQRQRPPLTSAPLEPGQRAPRSPLQYIKNVLGFTGGAPIGCSKSAAGALSPRQVI